MNALIRISVVLGLMLYGLFIIAVNCHAEEIDVPRMVQAIYISEGGALAQYPYGIRSVRFDSVEEAKKICENTVRNNIKRFEKQDKYTDYIEFLGSRYCPTSGNLSASEKKLNRNWTNNVRYWYKKLASEK